MAKPNQAARPTRDAIEWSNMRAERVAYEPDTTIFSQGQSATTVIYIETGSVRLSVVSQAGKEVVIATLAAGDFCGEGCVAGQTIRTATATAVSECAIMRIASKDIEEQLHSEGPFADVFVAHMLKRNIRLEEDLIDQLFNSTEKRLARALLLLADYGKADGGPRMLPKISQEILAEMVGTTRPRVNFFMTRFRKCGFIDYDAKGVSVNPSLLGVVLSD